MGNLFYTPPMPPIDQRGQEIVIFFFEHKRNTNIFLCGFFFIRFVYVQIEQYDIDQTKLQKVWKLFVDQDIDRNGFWTSQECYAMVQEPKISMVHVFENINFTSNDVPI